MRFAYADPPYIGQARKHYGNHHDFDGEVDHQALIDMLVTSYDAWALSCSIKSLSEILPMCAGLAIRVAAWIRTAPPLGDGFMYSWEPVIFLGGRHPEFPTSLFLYANPPGFSFRPVPAAHVIGEKPPAFSRWIFRLLGAHPSDTFDDLFTGSGAVGRAWAEFAAQGQLALQGDVPPPPPPARVQPLPPPPCLIQPVPPPGFSS